MSVDEVGKSRYWKREDVDGTIYFATVSNAGHARAEADTRATEVSALEYNSNVPKEVHNGADHESASNKQNRPTTEDRVIAAKQGAWASLQQWTQNNSEFVTIQDQIAMLELWKWQLCSWANGTMVAAQDTSTTTQGPNNVN